MKGQLKGNPLCLVQQHLQSMGTLCAYIYLNGKEEAKVARSLPVRNHGVEGDHVVVLDFNSDDVLIGIEILSASAAERIPLEESNA